MGEKTTADAPSAPEAKGPRQWLRATVDRVPTKWASAIGVGAFLAATAAFGGLNTAPPPPGPPELAAGEKVTTASLDMTVTRMFLADYVIDGVNIDSESHDRVLAVEVKITNLFDRFRLVRSDYEGIGATRIVDGPDETPEVTRPGEKAHTSLAMQPGLPDTFLLTWAVDADEYQRGDEVRIALGNPISARWQFFDQDLHWSNEGTSAYVTAALDDLGTGDPR